MELLFQNLKEMNPIFIIGITGRSGTHYIAQLLKRHKVIVNNSLIREDHFISELNYLELYVKNISYYWRKKNKNNKEHEEKIINNLKIGLGNGIINSVPTKKQAKYFLLGTPYTHNISLFPDYFPSQKMLIIIRNAKDVVESGVRSKFWNYEEGLELWNRSAKRIIEFKKQSKYPFLIVKYEDLFTSTIEELSKIFNYLDLKLEDFPIEELKKIPVQGSSDAKNEKNSWEYKNIKKDVHFKPLNRSENWSLIRKWRFNWKCGKNSEILNYKTEIINSKPFYFLINVFLDIVLFIFKIKLYIKPKVKKHIRK